MLNRISLIIVSLMMFQMTKGQKLLEFKSYDTTAYVYKLDKEQMDFLAERNTITDTAFLFKHLYEKFLRNSNYTNSLPNGNYLIATIDQARVNYNFVYKASFDIKHKVIGNDVIFFIKNKKSRENLSTAKVFLNNVLIPFDEGYGGYAFNKNSINAKLLAKNQVFLHIEKGEEYAVMRYNFIKGYQEPRQAGNSRGTYQTFNSAGYLINDKPVYRPGDTVKVKAFLTNPFTGLPVISRTEFNISEPNQNFSLTKKLLPLSPGAFVFKWKIPDTLAIDRTFQMAFSYKVNTNTFVKNSSFYLENYALSANQYSAHLTKSEYYPGEDAVIRLSATDVNRFPLQGTLVNCKLRFLYAQKFYGDTLTLSENRRGIYFEKDTVYPFQNSMDLKIPSALFPNMDANYNAEVTLTDPITYEQKSFLLDFSRQMKKEKLLAYQNADSLVIRYLFNERDTAKSYYIVSMSNTDTIFKRQIVTPYHVKLSPYTTLVNVYDKEMFATQVNVGFNHLDISRVKGERSADSIQITFSFPFDEAIYYRLLKKDKLVQQGKTKKLDYKIADNSGDPYTLLFTSNVNNAIENNYYQITYVPPLHRIKLQTTLPEQAFPGQKLLVNVSATDCYNQPLENINIAAYAVNKQFNERYVPPRIDVPEAFKDLLSVKQAGSINWIALGDNNFQNQYALKASHFRQFALHNNEYYQLRYPKTGLTVLHKDIQSPVPEFAVFITSNHLSYSPKYILLDGKPVYISDLDNGLYSFQVDTGQHEITFRFSNKKITLNNITFKPSKKYWLGFNIDSVKKSNGDITVVDSLPVLQPNASEKKLLYGSLLLTNQFGFDSILVKSGKTTVFQSNNRARSNPKSLNIDGDYFYVFGPLQENTNVDVRVNTNTFHLKGSSEYAHFFDRAKQEFTSKNRGPVKGAVFGFSERQISDYQFSQLQVQDSVKMVSKPPIADFTPKQGPAPIIKQGAEYTQRYNSSGGQGQFSIYFVNNQDSAQVKAVWLIDKKRPEESAFNQVLNKADLYTFNKNGGGSYYDLYFLMSNEKMVLLPNINLKNGEAFYVNPFLLKSVDITKEGLKKPLKVYNDLTRLPLAPFYFPPEESNEKIIETKDPERKNTYLHGSISNELNQPVPGVMVMAEINGKFMCGAITNAVGEYEILDMLPGSYQLKFYHASYQMKAFSTTYLKEGCTYELSTTLKDINQQRPLMEKIDKNFRFMAFNDTKRKGILKLQVYDKESREALSGFTITLSEKDNGAVVKELVTKENPELVFPQSDKTYKLEIRCNNYVPVVFHDIKFCKDLFYVLYLFMSSEKENPYITKNEYHLPPQNCQTQVVHKTVNNQPYRSNGINQTYAAGAPSPNYSGINSNIDYSTNKKINASRIYREAKSKKQENAQFSEEEWENNASGADKTPSGEEETTYASDDRIDQFLATPDINSTRTKFSDVGYWQPNHITDKQGQVNFEIRLPDNITTWKSNILAMGSNHLHGINFSETRAYKPLQVSATLPSYLWLGDKLWVKSKFTNLTKDEKNITTSVLINDQLITKKELSINNEHVDSVLLDAKSLNPLIHRAALQFEDKYKDEEQKEITVYNPAFRFYNNQTLCMEKDSVYRLTIPNNTKGYIILNNNLYEKIVEQIDQLGTYEYACVEQTSSQLLALLCRERINRALQLQENLRPRISRLINQLSIYQNKNGTWGWWKQEPTNWRMTIYAMMALCKANTSGYYNASYIKAMNAVKNNITNLSVSDQLYAISAMKHPENWDPNFKNCMDRMKPEELNPSDKIYYYETKKRMGDTINENDLYAAYLEVNNQVSQNYYGDFFNEPRTHLLAAYYLFSASSTSNEWLQLFKTKLLNGQLEKNLNTYTKAALIEALTVSASNTDNKPVTAQVVVNDSLKIKKFPYRLPITKSNYTLKHNGATVFVNTAEENYTDQPKTSDSLFKVRTQFSQNGKMNSNLLAGIPCQLNITVDAYRSFDYVMIEVPVPSGMQFVSKPQQNGYTVQYHKNKIVIFFQRLSMQQHNLSFELLPTFRGNFVWPAAKCSLMYYPYLFGNNQTQAIEIR